jgi:hypothetical protein
MVMVETRKLNGGRIRPKQEPRRDVGEVAAPKRHNQQYDAIYSIGSLNEPPSLNGPAAILSENFNLVLLHFVYGYHFVVSTLEKIGIHVATGLPKIYGFYRIIRRKSVCFRKRDPYPPL